MEQPSPQLSDVEDAASETPLPAEFRFARIVESTIQGVVDVLTQALYVIYVATRHPMTFASRLDHSERFGQPMTYLALATLIAAPGLTSVLQAPVMKGKSLFESLHETLGSISVERLVTESFPIVLLVVGTSQLLRLWGFRGKRLRWFQKCFYFAIGTAFIEAFIILLGLRLCLLHIFIETQMRGQPASLLWSILKAGCILLSFAPFIHAQLLMVGAAKATTLGWVDRLAFGATFAFLGIITGPIWNEMRETFRTVQATESEWFTSSPLEEPLAYGIKFEWNAETEQAKILFATRTPENCSVRILRENVRLTASRIIAKRRIEATVPSASVKVSSWQANESPIMKLNSETQWIEIGFTTAGLSEVRELIDAKGGADGESLKFAVEFLTVPYGKRNQKATQETIEFELTFEESKCVMR